MSCECHLKNNVSFCINHTTRCFLTKLFSNFNWKTKWGEHWGLRYWAFKRYFCNFNCGIAVSPSPSVCSLSSFCLTVFSNRSSFTVSQYNSFALSCLIQVKLTLHCMLFVLYTPIRRSNECAFPFVKNSKQVVNYSSDELPKYMGIWCIRAWDK